MTQRTLALLGITLAAALGACASTPPTSAMLTYESVPDGARIFEGGKLLGSVPVTRTYSSDGKSSTITTPDVRAVWPSGAQTTYFTILPLGSDRVATLQRPADAPGLQQDLEHARQVAAVRKSDAERRRELRQTEIDQASARCKQEQAQGTQGLSDDCR
jgi:hypothetical protein